MQPTSVRVPVSLLCDPGLTPVAKLVWIARWLHGPAPAHSLRALGQSIGLDKSTVHRASATLAAHPQPAAEPHVSLPTDLLTQGDLGVSSRLLYGLLQLTTGITQPAGTTTYAALRTLSGLDLKTLRRALHQLVEAGWITAKQASQRQPIEFALRHPLVDRGAMELNLVKDRIARGGFHGETLMREYLSLLIGSAQFSDNAAPGFLVNPLTNQRLQFDRYYPPRVAFEFQGRQHFVATRDYPESLVAQQRARDLMKRGICQEEGIELIHVLARDLSLSKMQAKVGALLPLRDLQGLEPVAAYLDQESRKYRRSPKVHAPVHRAGRGRRHSGATI